MEQPQPQLLKSNFSKDKIVKIILLVCLLVSILLTFYFKDLIAAFVKEFGEGLGLFSQESLIAGTGSMYPTFPKGRSEDKLEQFQEIVTTAKARKFPGGIKLFSKRYFDYKLQRGDIIFFSSDKTDQIVEKEYQDINISNQLLKKVGFVKRVIALPSDKLEISDGFVYLNDQLLNEPYIASARSTFGGDFLPDCQLLSIPKNHVFVMGDNRKGSNDSRFDVELVSFDEISSVISIDKQDNLKANWRDVRDDVKSANLATLSVDRFVSLLNQKRAEVNLPAYRHQPQLALSASKRAEAILKFNDFSFEATRSGYTMEKAMAEANYSNIVWGEAPSLGYYSEDELMENSFEFAQRRQFLLNKDFQEIGIFAKVGVLNGCPVQIVVIHMAGYVPPNYKIDEIDNVKVAIAKLKEIQPSWEGLKKHKAFYGKNRAEVDRINLIIAQRIGNLEVILKRMAANEWFSNEEKRLLVEDKALGEEQNSLAEKLNRSQ